MKFFISVLLIAAVSFAACLYLPWWMVAVAGFLVALLVKQSGGRSFLSGFAAVFILWFCLCFWLSSANRDIFAHKISLLIMKKDSPAGIMILSALIGGLVAGFGALSGSFLRSRKAER